MELNLIIGFIVILVIILSVSIYFLLKTDEDSEENLLEKIDKLDDEDIKSIIKTSSVDTKYFENGIKNLQINIDEFKKFKEELGKVIVGLDEFVNSIIVGMLANGHILVEGVPGLAKTKTIYSVSQILDMDFNRVQFTPDMMPSDIIGIEIYNQKKGEFEIKKGPVFTNILLADEINRTTPKVQSALLEAMQERRVNISGIEFDLPKPFFVLATQNPLEQEGTYPLPEAQVDRFLFKVLVDYPTFDEEKKVLDYIEEEDKLKLSKILDKERFIEIQENIKNIKVSNKMKEYIVRLIRSTRQKDERILYGVSPRGAISILLSSKVVAFLKGKDYVDYEDIQSVALSCTRHRLIISYDAKIDGYTEDQILLEKFSKVNL